MFFSTKVSFESFSFLQELPLKTLVLKSFHQNRDSPDAPNKIAVIDSK